MAAFGEWLEVRGHDAGALFGRAVRGGRLASGGSRMSGSQLSRAIGHQPRGLRHSLGTTCVGGISELLDAGADLATVQKMVGHESVTTMAGYDRRGDAAKRKAADLVHVPFFPRQA